MGNVLGTERTLSPHCRRYLRERKARGTYSRKSIESVRGRLDTLDRSFGHRPLRELNRRAIERWLASLGHLAQSSRSSYLASIRTFTRWLVLDGVIRSDPCADVEPIPRPRSVPRAQTPRAVAAVLAACEDDRDRAVIWLMVGLGLRRAEVAGARWEDYDPQGRTLLVKGKGGHERFLPVPDGVAEALERVRGRGTTGPIIRSKCHTGSISVGWVGKRVSDLMGAAGLKRAPYDGVSAHALRHTAASDVLDRCHDLRVVQAMLGHEHLSSTSIYLRRADIGQLREAMEGRRYAHLAAV